MSARPDWRRRSPTPAPTASPRSSSSSWPRCATRTPPSSSSPARWTSSNASTSRWSERSRSSSTTGPCCSCSTTASTSCGAVVPLVQRLSRHCPRLTVLATGRAPLGLPGELVHVLAPLGVPAAGAGGDEARASAAVQLFADRAAEARPGFRLDERNMPAVAEICRKLDGLPLAIELAAARMRSIGAEALADRLDQRFALLADHPASPDPRHRNLHRLVEWSYELLEPRRPAGVRRRGGVRRQLRSRRRRSRVPADARRPLASGGCRDRPGRQVDGPGGRPGRAAVPAAGDVARLRPGATPARPNALAPAEQRHREWFADVAERAAVGLDTPDEGRWITRIDRDLDNFRAAHAGAVAAGDLAIAARLVAALREYAFRRVRYEIASWAEATTQLEGFERSPSAPDRARCRRLRTMGARRPRCRDRARPPLDRRRRLAPRTVDRPGRAGPRQRRLLQRGDGRTPCTGWSGWPRPPRRAADRPP